MSQSFRQKCVDEIDFLVMDGSRAAGRRAHSACHTKPQLITERELHRLKILNALRAGNLTYAKLLANMEPREWPKNT